MALSEHEEALLQQMEEALYAEDPRFASRIEKTKSRSAQRGRILTGIVGAVAGVAIVVVSAMSSWLWLGAVGFVVMVAGIVFAITPSSRAKLGTVEEDGSVTPVTKGKARKQPRTGTFMERLEERWERRRRDQW